MQTDAADRQFHEQRQPQPDDGARTVVPTTRYDGVEDDGGVCRVGEQVREVVEADELPLGPDQVVVRQARPS